MTDKEIYEFNDRCARFMGLKQNKFGCWLLKQRDHWYGGNCFNEWASTDYIQDDSIYPGYLEPYWELSSEHLGFHNNWSPIMTIIQKICQSNYEFKGTLATPKEELVQMIGEFLDWHETRNN